MSELNKETIDNYLKGDECSKLIWDLHLKISNVIADSSPAFNRDITAMIIGHGVDVALRACIYSYKSGLDMFRVCDILEEKTADCDHQIGRDYLDDVYESCLSRMTEDEKTAYWGDRGWKKKFKHCPKCGDKIKEGEK